MQKTQEEIDEMSPAELKLYNLEQQKVVFGDTHKKDRKGNPIEHGIGAPGHETDNHFKAIGKSEGKEAEAAARAAAKARGKKAGAEA